MTIGCCPFLLIPALVAGIHNTAWTADLLLIAALYNRAGAWLPMPCGKRRSELGMSTEMNLSSGDWREPLIQAREFLRDN